MKQHAMTVELLGVSRLRDGVYAIQYRVGDLPEVAQELNADDKQAAWNEFQKFAAANNWVFKTNNVFDKLIAGEFEE
jgi:hypothetical protein